MLAGFCWAFFPPQSNTDNDDDDDDDDGGGDLHSATTSLQMSLS